MAEHTPEEILAVKRSVVEVARLLATRGLVGTYEGNVSARLGDLVYATPSTTSKESLTPEDIVVCDLDGNQLEGAKAITSEITLHLVCYRERPDVGAVVHCHAPFCTAFAQAEMDFSDPASAECEVMFGTIPCVPYGLQGTPELSRHVPEYVADNDVFFLAHHGVVGVGASCMDAYAVTMTAEMLIKTYFIRRTLFGSMECALPEEELRRLRAMHADRATRKG